MGRPLHISSNEVTAQSERIFRVVKYGESGIGVCYPGCKIDYNLSSFLDDASILRRNLGKHYKKYLCIHISCDHTTTYEQFLDNVYDTLPSQVSCPATHTLDSFCDACIQAGYDPYFFVTNLHLLQKKALKAILADIQHVVLIHARVGAQVFLEQNIAFEPWKSVFLHAYKLLQNISYFPVYTRKESLFFLQTVAVGWDMSMKKAEMEKIVDMCGGYLWLLREAMRLFRDTVVRTAEELLFQDGMQTRVTAISALFSDAQQQAIVRLCEDAQYPVSSYMMSYLLNLHIIEKQKTGYRMPSQLLFRAMQQNKREDECVVIHNHHIVVLGQDKTVLFQKNELDILALLHQKPRIVITREEIAHCLWGKHMKNAYSDWALDKKMSRIRQTLTQCGLPKGYIRTKKGVGFFLGVI